MSLRLAIPRRVGLHQSPLLLHQPRTILEEMRVFEKEKPLNGRCDTFKLSHRRGSRSTVTILFNNCGEKFQQFCHPTVVVILYEAFGQFLQIFLDGRPLVKDPNPQWNGYSLGKWDGDTLVVESS